MGYTQKMIFIASIHYRYNILKSEKEHQRSILEIALEHI